jgi:Chaperone of endosialidase
MPLGKLSSDGVARGSVNRLENCGFSVSQAPGGISYDSFMKTTALPLRHPMNLSPMRPAFLLIPLAIACLALLPKARAVCQQGCDLRRENTFLGNDALASNTSGVGNTATGAQALKSNTVGNHNTATGDAALFSNRFGFDNTATGVDALYSNNFGNNNTANGQEALFSNTDGNFNTATGGQALELNTTGNYNTASGDSALFSNTTGSSNVALGFEASENISTGSNNIAIGSSAGINLTTGSNNIDIGNQGIAGESNAMRIGTQGTQTDTYIAGVWQSIVIGTGSPVRVNSSGKLGTAPSSARFKEEIQPMDKASEAILALKPVTFRYKPELDPEGIPQFGLVAEDVEKMNPDLVVHDDQGKPYTVRYEAVNAMLLNEFLKEHKAFSEAQHKVEKLETTVASLVATVKEQAAQIQRVNAQLELSKTAPQTVLNE